MAEGKASACDLCTSKRRNVTWLLSSGICARLHDRMNQQLQRTIRLCESSVSKEANSTVRFATRGKAYQG